MFLAYSICYLAVSYIIGTLIHRAGGFGMTGVKDEALQAKISNLGFWMSPMIVPTIVFFAFASVLQLIATKLMDLPTIIIKVVYSSELKKENERVRAAMNGKVIKVSGEDGLAAFIKHIQESAEAIDNEKGNAVDSKDKVDKVH